MAKPSVTAARAIVDDVLGRGMTRELWTGNYQYALPISIQDFDLTAVLPAMFYMFRFGFRRGKGKFIETFAGKSGTARELRDTATIDRVAEVLSGTETLRSCDDPVKRALLGDLLLCFCLENRGRELGRGEPIQRVAPAHYMSSWLDLPQGVANLRFVPEMMVAMLADRDGTHVEPTEGSARTWFAVARGFEDNVLLKAFHQGVVREALLGDRRADRFTEETAVGLDQLLMVRLAQQLGEPPAKLHGKDAERISNQRPIAERASREFSEDIRQFVRGYSGVIPRHAFVELLESCMSVGLTTTITSTFEILFQWSRTGTITSRTDQKPAELFVDCSNGVDYRLRSLAEQSLDDYFRRLEYVPAILMALRLLDYSARYDRALRSQVVTKQPYATTWLNLLGDLLTERHPDSRMLLNDLDRKSQALSERLVEDYPEASAILDNADQQPNPVWRMAEALTLLQGRKNTQNNISTLLDSAMMANRPNGLAAKRAVIRKDGGSGVAKKRDVRSFVLNDSTLDYLVHRHVLRNGKKLDSRPIPLKKFLDLLLSRTGLHVDRSPPGLGVSNELLRHNRQTLERRLRDLGLLVGVNDAESMKYLKPRFDCVREGNDELD